MRISLLPSDVFRPFCRGLIVLIPLLYGCASYTPPVDYAMNCRSLARVTNSPVRETKNLGRTYFGGFTADLSAAGIEGGWCEWIIDDKPVFIRSPLMGQFVTTENAQEAYRMLHLYISAAYVPKESLNETSDTSARGIAELWVPEAARYSQRYIALDSPPEAANLSRLAESIPMIETTHPPRGAIVTYYKIREMPSHLGDCIEYDLKMLASGDEMEERGIICEIAGRSQHYLHIKLFQDIPKSIGASGTLGFQEAYKRHVMPLFDSIRVI